MMGPLRHGLANLTRFAGRDGRTQFWSYAAFVIGAAFVLMWVTTGMMVSSALDEMAGFAREHPDQARVTSGPGSYSIQIEGHHPELLPDIGLFVGGITLGVALIVLLLGAAVARRLHDTGRSGWWGLLPIPFLSFGMGGFVVLFESFGEGEEPDFGLFGLLFANNLLYFASLGVLVFLLTRRSAPEPNRYGEAG